MYDRLNDIFRNAGTDKHPHGYSETYSLVEAILTPTSIYEIGIFEGASLRAWREAFPKIRLVAMDNNPNRTVVAPGDVEILTGDATIQKPEGSFDWIIDDGSHKNSDIIDSFNLLFRDSLNPGGFYIIEDVHTSYYGDSYNSPGEPTGVEFTYRLIDSLLNQNGRNEKYNPSDPPLISRVIFGKSIIAIQKRK